MSKWNRNDQVMPLMVYHCDAQLGALPAQFIGELVQLLLCTAQLRLQVLPRGVKLALQELQLVCGEGEPFPQVLLLLQQ